MRPLGALLILAGLLLALAGALVYFADRLPWLGRLPGDIVVERGRLRVYVPVVTMLLVSILLTVLLNLFLRRR